MSLSELITYTAAKKTNTIGFLFELGTAGDPKGNVKPEIRAGPTKISVRCTFFCAFHQRTQLTTVTKHKKHESYEIVARAYFRS